MSAKRLGQLISERRKERGLTQTQLAEALGVNKSRVSQYERGVSVPNKYMVDLARVLDIHPQDLLAYTLDFFTPVEEALLHDSLLDRRMQDLMLTIYGQLTERRAMESPRRTAVWATTGRSSSASAGRRTTTSTHNETAHPPEEDERRVPEPRT